ncbi:MAG: glycosyltransferase family 2 protein, partial [Flavobacteriaceae bacterium]
MKVCIIIPVFNEQDFIKKSVESLINQTIKPAEVIYVNDNSTDNSKNIIRNLIGNCEWIRVIDHKSVQEHVPGSKVIEAFNFGLKNLETQFDIICKFDGDIILPKNYIEKTGESISLPWKF